MTSFDWFYPKEAKKGRRLVYDLETNGLLPDVGTLHCVCIEDLDTGETWKCADDGKHTPIAEGLKLLSEAALLVAHNGLSYDYPVLKHLRPGWDTKAVIRDTLVMSKMIWPTDRLKELDFPRWRSNKLPGSMIGAHRLEAWGFRLGEMKGDYSTTVKAWSKKLSSGEVTIADVPADFHCLEYVDDKGRWCLDPWKALNQPMLDYCVQDVKVTVAFFRLVESHLMGTASAAKGIAWSPRVVDLEHRMWAFCDRLQARGFGFDLPGGVKLAADLKNRQSGLAEKLIEVFGSWWQPLSDPEAGERPAKDRSVVMTELPTVTVERLSEKTGKALKPYVGPPKAHYSVDAPFVKIERVTFSPSSRKHLGDRLQAVFGWQPSSWGGAKGDQATVDETTIKEMDESILPPNVKELILEFLVISKALGQLADGRKAWIALCGEDQRLHGRVDPLGTVSHRGAHADPNLGNVPGVTIKETKDTTGAVIAKEVVWGWKGGFGAECRSLFRPGIRTALGKPGFKCQTGIDASGLQLRCLGHYLAPYDGGAFSARVSTPGLDIHLENSKLTGLSRSETKTVTYAWLFGAGPLKIGIGVGVTDDEIDAYASSPAAKSYLKFMQKVSKDPNLTYDKKTMAYIGKGSEVIKKFVNGIEGLKDLKDAIKKEAETYGFIIGADGRKLHIRKPHAALNQALQGAEAIICKEWILEHDRLLQEAGLVPDVHYGQLCWVHDEEGLEHEDGLQELIAQTGAEAMRNVELMLDFKCPLAVDAKHGTSWFDTH